MRMSIVSGIAGHDARPLPVLIGGLLLANGAAWAWAFAQYWHHPVLLGTALLAYTLGLRHAVDADHIAAIDNVTRKLVQQGRPSYKTGLYFALGHSTIVVALSLAVAAAATAVQGRFEAIRAFGSLIGTSVSGVFLLIIAGANAAVFVSVVRALQQVQRGEAPDPGAGAVGPAGDILSLVFGRAFNLVECEGGMYPLGVLFGLGFDTATEIGLLAISAAQASANPSVWSILVFPALFTAGMTLLDTLDGVMMAGACRWAVAQPLRRLYYNMVITVTSVLVAVLIGAVQMLGLLGAAIGGAGPFWNVVARLNAKFTVTGLAIIGVVAFIWALSAAAYRVAGRHACVTAATGIGRSE